jgi:hypothetical protein
MINVQDSPGPVNPEKEGVSKENANISAPKKPLPPSFTSTGKEDVCPKSSKG